MISTLFLETSAQSLVLQQSLLQPLHDEECEKVWNLPMKNMNRFCAKNPYGKIQGTCQVLS